MNKVRSIAQALDGRILRVVEENENSTVGGTGPIDYDSNILAQESKTRAATPIAAGQLSIQSKVQLIVEIEN